LDPAAYISRYSGNTKAIRLQFMADRCSNLRVECLRQLILEIKKGSNTTYYNQVMNFVNNMGGPETFVACGHQWEEMKFDQAWAQNADRKSSQRLERLEADLVSARSTMVKESIRLAYMDIGNYYYELGIFQEAIKNYNRSKEFCTLSKHHVDMCLHVISTYIDMSQYRNVSNFVGKAETPDLDGVTNSKLMAAAGIVALHDNNFKAAARKFLSIDGVIVGEFSNIIAAEDIALYGVLCGVATLSRSEVRASLSANPSFKGFLEITPDVRSFSQNFLSGQYADCLEWLTTVRPQLLLDIHIAHCADTIISLIKDQVFIQQFSPYKSMDMNKMAASLRMPIETIEMSVESLISKGQIPARIDSQTKTMHRNECDERTNTLERILSLANKHAREMRRNMLRLSLMEHDLQVTSKESNKKNSSAAGGTLQGDEDEEIDMQTSEHPESEFEVGDGHDTHEMA